ncbi:hypothetical protein [Pedobacter sp. UBA4863]|uniref:hypothetical protein n=1 Tax=Pedobacter sp. UBA4863 TaxID=1947060 RepID=UPI0025EF43AF|nr:hypothetical protein [Pedobacter sp. UBA4863]
MNRQTYDSICFTELAYEFDFSDNKEIEKKIKRRLKHHKLGDFKQERIDYIRRLKNDLYSEITSQKKSKYFHKSKPNFADLADFNFERMTEDYHNKYENIDKEDLKGMINFAIYLYHMR